jgi:hypothetical protein
MLARIKFDIAELVNLMLDQLPDQVIINGTFLDPAMGGGQFVKEIERRKRLAGKTDQEIQATVFGIEKNILRRDYAVNRFGLVGTYSVGDFMTATSNIKFDVIIGNPPFENPGKSKGQKLWYKYIFKAHELVNAGGYLAMVTPSSWIRGGVNHGRQGVLKDIFGVEQLQVAAFNDVTKRYFGKSAIEISWWILERTANYKKTKMILRDTTLELDLKGVEVLSPVADSDAMSILAKFIDSSRAKESVLYYNYKNPDRSIESKTATAQHKIKHWVHGCDSRNNATYTYLPKRYNDKLAFKKIVFLIGSRYWQPHVDLDSVGVVAQGFAIKIKDGWTKDNILSVYESKLWKLVFFNFQLQQNGFMKNAIVKKTPAMDMSKKWTDQAIYAHFGLSADEIAYIESAVK